MKHKYQIYCKETNIRSLFLGTHTLHVNKNKHFQLDFSSCGHRIRQMNDVAEDTRPKKDQTKDSNVFKRKITVDGIWNSNYDKK